MGQKQVNIVVRGVGKCEVGCTAEIEMRLGAMVRSIVNLPIWWQFGLWIAAPYFVALATYIVNNIVIANTWSRRFGLTLKNSRSIIRETALKGLPGLRKRDGILLSMMGAALFAIVMVVCILGIRPGLADASMLSTHRAFLYVGYIGAGLGVLVNLRIVLSRLDDFQQRKTDVIERILEFFENEHTPRRGGVSDRTLKRILALLAGETGIRTAAKTALRLLNATAEQLFAGYIYALEKTGISEARIEAASALAELGNKKAIPILERILSRTPKIMIVTVWREDYTTDANGTMYPVSISEENEERNPEYDALVNAIQILRT